MYINIINVYHLLTAQTVVTVPETEIFLYIVHTLSLPDGSEGLTEQPG